MTQLLNGALIIFELNTLSKSRVRLFGQAVNGGSQYSERLSSSHLTLEAHDMRSNH